MVFSNLPHNPLILIQYIYRLIVSNINQTNPTMKFLVTLLLSLIFSLHGLGQQAIPEPVRGPIIRIGYFGNFLTHPGIGIKINLPMNSPREEIVNGIPLKGSSIPSFEAGLGYNLKRGQHHLFFIHAGFNYRYVGSNQLFTEAGANFGYAIKSTMNNSGGSISHHFMTMPHIGFGRYIDNNENTPQGIYGRLGNHWILPDKNTRKLFHPILSLGYFTEISNK